MSTFEDLTVRIQHFVWQRRVESWEHEASPNLGKVIDAVIEEAAPGPEMLALDLGCGSGQVSLRLAPQVAELIGVDISERMVERMLARAAEDGLSRVRGQVSPLERLELARNSVDLIVSNYVFHHLNDDAKARVVQLCYGWLKPGGRLVIGDMMFGRGGTTQDRQVIMDKVKLLAAKGIGGYWRIAKNAVRYLLRVQEKPIAKERWVNLFETAGFKDVHVRTVVAEAGVVVGMKSSDAGAKDSHD
ncbi:MAG: class I SAM-dependent methyltransferase [Ferrimicrobium sp.]|jgi:ubiquinone/menaquinone biosynthesis C-methylase UbiE|uniref:Class I SAM-dependent methyltransferase n=1 Tax=Ferrimicrobium acidiphilum TaxID=121039 RepID=A0ABV3Y1F3_9ACTN|nr:class I SAM-dependent methyltransferase [Ferrimicrobium sp.]